MKSGIFLIILLTIGNMTILYNHTFVYADEIVLAEFHSVSGSDAVSTDTLTKERCFVHVDITIKSAHHDGIYHRNNPDETFYPGDAFVYSVNTWIDGCGHFQPCPIQSTANLLGVSNGVNCIQHGHDGDGNPSGGTYGASSDSGTGMISPSYSSGVISMSKKAIAEQWVCHKSGDTWNCGWNTVSASASYSPPVILPNLEVTMKTDGYEFTENDGYTSRNLDKSYYVWDAINLVHNPLYEWKNDRVGTIYVEIEKIHDPLILEEEFLCELASCTNTMEVSGFLPWTGTFDYGGGNTVYNATSLADIGEHEIAYHTRLYNIVPQIDDNINSTSVLAVEYEPIYDSYVYPVLSDDERLAFHDRMGIALHYFGSESTDVNPDDTIGIHEDRRSKINDYFYSTWGADPWEFEFIDGTSGISDYSDDIELTWDEAHDVGIVTNQLPVKLSEHIADQLIPTEFAGIIPFEVKEHSTANFLKSGYGKIFFNYPGLYDVVLDAEKKIPRYENATVFDTLESRHFAGHDLSFLSFDEYMYPESFFHNAINVTAVDSAQNRDDSVEISLDVQPRFDIDGTQYIDQYMYDKIFFDSTDDGFAQIIAGLDIDGNSIVVVNDDDIYPMNENNSSGFGSIALEKTRRTASSFSQYGIIDPQVFANDNVVDVSDKYLLDSLSAKLPIPLTTGLDALSPFHVVITANNGIDGEPVTNVFNNTWYDFSVDYNYQINMDSDNVLNIQRDAANPRVLLFQHDENFGEISSLQINDVTILKDDLPECFKTDSSGTCVIAVPHNHQLSELNITAVNIWNGMASVTLPEIDETILNPTPKDLEHLIFEGVLESWIVVILVFLLMMLAIFWIIKRYREQN